MGGGVLVGARRVIHRPEKTNDRVTPRAHGNGPVEVRPDDGGGSGGLRKARDDQLLITDVVVDPGRFELPTSALQRQRSTN
jgi:hypothetical protein